MSRCIVLWLALNCACFGFRSQVQAVRKCCGEHRVLDYERQRCSFPQTHAYNSSFTEDSIYATERFPFQCPAGLSTANVTLHNLSGTVTIPDSNKTLQYSEFCVASEPLENESVTIAFCKPQTIDKCCPIGQAIHPSLRKCVPAQDAPTVEKLKRYEGDPLVVAHDASKREYYVNYCIYQLTKYNESILLDQYNQALITEGLFNRTKNVSFYCIDALAESASSNYSVVAMVGNPWRQQSYYHNIRKFFPQFCFGSSFFLFLTMLYYCTTLNQRRNIHTYSMICFLFSMMIVQLDIGIAFSIAARTCVCAFIPYHRNYFRYASTAWTTVMGYIIWNQLTRNATLPSMERQKSLAKTFGLFSLYAWGISLVFVLAGVIYDQYNPLTTPCWWTAQHVKIFMDAPNIAMQLLNNIFFIPSAMHVWRSFRFVRQSFSSRAASAVVGKRKMAVVKMFAMMQSTKLAEILFSIRSLFDIQSDEYFMATMVLYTIIGPILFCVLVDIPGLISRLPLRKLREQVQSSVLRHSASVVSLFRPSDSLSFDPSTESTSSALDVVPVKYLRKVVSSDIQQPDASSNQTST